MPRYTLARNGGDLLGDDTMGRAVRRPAECAGETASILGRRHTRDL